ncbi:hypothetical protein [Cupriavidus campinensis]
MSLICRRFREMYTTEDTLFIPFGTNELDDSGDAEFRLASPHRDHCTMTALLRSTKPYVNPPPSGHHIRRRGQGRAGRLGRLETAVSRLETDTSTLKADVTTLKADVLTLKTDVSTLKTDVATLKTDVATLKTDVSTLKTDVSTLKTDVSLLKDGVSDIRVAIAKLDAKLDFGALRAEIQRTHTDIYKWIATIVVAGAGLAFAVYSGLNAGTSATDQASLQSQYHRSPSAPGFAPPPAPTR